MLRTVIADGKSRSVSLEVKKNEVDQSFHTVMAVVTRT